MHWLKAFLTSSVGRKFVVGLTGLFLCFFLVVHLAGNLLLYVGVDAYNEYAHKLHSNEELLIIAETLLFAALIGHILIAAGLTFTNWRNARNKSYRTFDSKREDRTTPMSFAPDQTMMLTGLFVLIFLICHLSDFKFGLGWENLGESYSPAQKALLVLENTWRQGIYLVGVLFLGYHVSHGLQSAFQSLGLNHPKYMPTIRRLSVLFGLVVAIGFGSFPIAGLVRSQTNPTSVEQVSPVEGGEAVDAETPHSPEH